MQVQRGQRTHQADRAAPGPHEASHKNNTGPSVAGKGRLWGLEDVREHRRGELPLTAMAKRSKKRRKGTAKNLYLADDKVSVVSSAHASNRVPKALQSLKALRQDAAETLEDGATEQEDDEDFVPDTWELRSTRTSRNQSEMATVREHEGSIVYPYDIWESISNYIRPEDICTFSVLCRSAYAVVNKAKFWMRLYQDLYREDAPLPSHLTPDCMARRHQLKWVLL